MDAPRPTPLSRVWSKNRIIAEDLTGEDLSDVLELHSDASAWWVLPRDDQYAAAELREVARALDLDQLAIKDLLANDHRVKYEEVGQARLVITSAVSVDAQQGKIIVHPVSIIATDRALICLSSDHPALQPAQLLSAKGDQLARDGVESALPLVLAAIIDTYEQAVHWLETAGDELADALFDQRPLNRAEQLTAFRLKKALSRLRRLTEPMRTVLADLIDELPPPTKRTVRPGHATRHWTLVAEHHRRVADAADAQREALTSIFQTSLSLVEERSNDVMKKLTGWAAIIAVPTLVTGFVGMNVKFPMEGTTAGFWLYLAVMVAAALVLYVVLKLRNWLYDG